MAEFGHRSCPDWRLPAGGQECQKYSLFGAVNKYHFLAFPEFI